jgi:putative AbiEii toxin of type IV toxin-antitoxin system
VERKAPAREEWFVVDVPQEATFGPLQSGFSYSIAKGYTALVGANNAGKSAILQLAFRVLMNHAEFGAERMCFIPPDRHYLADTLQTGDKTLANWNAELYGYIGGVPTLLPYQTPVLTTAELPRLLIANDFRRHLDAVARILERLGFGELAVGGRQALTFEDVAVFFNGSGLRALFPIIAALTDRSLRLILIDEPEISLEPTLQRALRELLVENAAERAIIVSTHSHLFVEREPPESTQVVQRSGGSVTVRPITRQSELIDVIFGLLGNSTEDLLFPLNYLVVEGGSDQTYVERALDLLGIERGRIKVVAAGGIDAVRETIVSVERALLPLVFDDSPYKPKVVALIDAPPAGREALAAEIADELSDRFFVLDTPSVEEYVHESLYERVGLNRDEVLRELQEMRGSYAEKRSRKAEIAKTIADSLTPDDLDLIPQIRDAARRAADVVDALI